MKNVIWEKFAVCEGDFPRKNVIVENFAWGGVWGHSAKKDVMGENSLGRGKGEKGKNLQGGRVFQRWGGDEGGRSPQILKNWVVPLMKAIFPSPHTHK